MASITTRAGKGSPLTNAELDANFNNINAQLSTAVITGGTIDGATIGATTATTGKFSQLDVDNLRLDGNTIVSTDTNGNIDLTPNGTGEVNITKVDIDAGTIDNTAIGGSTAAAGTFTSLSDSGNLTFTGTGNRITGDFSNATIANRVAFQTSTTNGNTDINVLPNGTALQSQFSVQNNSDPTNSGRLTFLITSTEANVRSGISGTGTYLPMTFYTGGSERVRVDTSGNVGIGTSSPVTYGRFAVVSNGDYAPSATFISNSSAANWARADWDNVNVAYNGIIYQDQGGLFNIRNDGANAIAFSTNGGNERMRIDSSGNVGIGTSSPNGLLHVNGTINIGSQTQNSTSTAVLENRVTSDPSTTARAAITLGTTAGASSSDSYIAFTTNQYGVSRAERMRITSTGDVGIGTSSPSVKLHVVGSGKFTGITEFTNAINLTTSTLNYVYFNDALAFSRNGTGERMRIDSSGNVGIGVTTIIAPLQIGVAANSSPAGNTGLTFRQATGAPTAGQGYSVRWDNSNNTASDVGTIAYGFGVSAASAGYMRFSTADTERMRIDGGGNLLVGTTSADQANTRMQVNGGNAGTQMFVFKNTQVSGTAYVLQAVLSYTPNDATSRFMSCGDSTGDKILLRSNGGLANYSANDANLSDRREKTNFAPAKSYLDVICAIPVQTFNYIDQNLEEDAGLTLGVVAQDVQAVAPELVSESNWGTEEAPKMRLSIYQTDLQYALMKCIQEQQALITALTTRITALEST